MDSITSILLLHGSTFGEIHRIRHTLPVRSDHGHQAGPSSAILWIAALCVIAGTVLFWWWNSRPRAKELEPAWEARVVVLAGAGMHASFDDPFGIAARPDGTIFVSDGLEAPRVRSSLPDGSVVDVTC